MSDKKKPSRADIRRWRRYLAEERMEAQTYRTLATHYTGEEHDILNELAEAERRHENYWLSLLGDHAVPPPQPSLHQRLTAFLARQFGSIFVMAMAQRTEERSAYDTDEDAPRQMAADEHIHGEVVRSLSARTRQSFAGTFRAAVFGVNDGLVSNLALVLGVAATGMERPLVLATGVSGLLAGALSMAAGEWVSVSSQKELLDASVPDPHADQSISHLDVNANELTLVYRARGESQEEARAHAEEVMGKIHVPVTTTSGSLGVRTALADPRRSMTGASEEIGTPLRAALSSFLCFAAGAALPLIPLLLGLSGTVAIAIAIPLVGVALMMIGGIVGVLSGQKPMIRGLRQLGIGYGAALVTWLLGTLLGGGAI